MRVLRLCVIRRFCMRCVCGGWTGKWLRRMYPVADYTDRCPGFQYPCALWGDLSASRCHGIFTWKPIVTLRSRFFSDNSRDDPSPSRSIKLIDRRSVSMLTAVSILGLCAATAGHASASLWLPPAPCSRRPCASCPCRHFVQRSRSKRLASDVRVNCSFHEWRRTGRIPDFGISAFALIANLWTAASCTIGWKKCTNSHT